MRIVAISDTHGYQNALKMPRAEKGDVFIFAGDMSQVGKLSEVSIFCGWIEDLKYDYKIIIAGNHDWCFYRDQGLGKAMFGHIQGCYYLEDEEKIINGVKFYGTPWTPEFCNWAFMGDDHKLESRWRNIPKDIDVLISHGPPLSILDKTFDDRAAGSHVLLEKIMKIKPDLHFFGHIHEGRGHYHFEHTDFYNISFDPEVAKPIIVDYEKE